MLLEKKLQDSDHFQDDQYQLASGTLLLKMELVCALLQSGQIIPDEISESFTTMGSDIAPNINGTPLS